MEIQITEAKTEEAAIIHRIMREAFQEYAERLVPPSGALRETVDDIIRKMNSGGAIIARIGDAAVGAAQYSWNDGYLYIGRVSVMPDYRGLGIGKYMMEHIEKLAAANHVFETRLGVRLSIPQNVAFYKSLKYEVLEKHDYPDKTDSWYIMNKRLSDEVHRLA
ncbi:GNAT family N-acetyltransferase [Gorillibacterium massiliense]|uniref:GNAT family N-acetyltransferase n=1 Tax=Gorillibacterium massiliense TaxID=1280390 RepID=UPI0004AE8B8D|nr:GNAT family N-acetyltransferase [Gorillibacterium massiliense]